MAVRWCTDAVSGADEWQMESGNGQWTWSSSSPAPLRCCLHTHIYPRIIAIFVVHGILPLAILHLLKAFHPPCTSTNLFPLDNGSILNNWSLYLYKKCEWFFFITVELPLVGSIRTFPSILANNNKKQNWWKIYQKIVGSVLHMLHAWRVKSLVSLVTGAKRIQKFNFKLCQSDDDEWWG